jgi:crotonobetainyl-CoA:carnitine CoA-transferase CaiB-like acyl-CoA transferase
MRLIKGMGPDYEYLKKIKYFGVAGLERFKAAKEMNEAIKSWTAKHTCSEIEEALRRPDIDIPCLKVPSFYEILENEHYKAREMFAEVEQPFFGKVKVFGCPIKMASVKCGNFEHSPILGEHNEQILKWLGYSENEIFKLYEEEVLKKE